MTFALWTLMSQSKFVHFAHQHFPWYFHSKTILFRFIYLCILTLYLFVSSTITYSILRCKKRLSEWIASERIDDKGRGAKLCAQFHMHTPKITCKLLKQQLATAFSRIIMTMYSLIDRQFSPIIMSCSKDRRSNKEIF